MVLAVPATAQEAQMDPIVAKQCSVWASFMSTNIEDEGTQRALLFATNYFTGYYEGATGRAIGDVMDREALEEVARDLQGYTQICAAEMEAFGTRMSAWGNMLTDLGNDESAAEGAPE
ncbi:hypothetical protein E5222_08290 [Alteraurantiacibacter aquimixticola]|uniref:Uncharacterized protein n=2 Tax=Alteraurantiacibacter aquimixticola TaxID=2489173 RepID=A0A4T3F036_9SPHN|nr:hypothetical protein E5222_08290 [Alteraurantiacibacter aquimixticola]